MSEKMARIVAAVFLLGGITAIGVAWWSGQSNVITLHAHMPEEGGWMPADLTVAAGQPLHLRLTSDDVVHSFAVGQSDFPVVDVMPGEFTEITLKFDEPGIHTFYCTRWCGANHWRMRGTITVTGEDVEEPFTQPLYVQLGLDIDAPHKAEIVPVDKPSAQRGVNLGFDLSKYLSQDYYRSHQPEQVWKDLRIISDFTAYSDQELWDAVAFIWNYNTTPDALVEARQLYAQNCAACHGEKGAGDGVFSGEQFEVQEDTHVAISGHEIVNPTDFTDPHHMLALSPAHLQGKIIRGGMGTGMPMWGVIFTEEQTWSLVSYLYTFQFEEVRK
jgi:mono/diheme cytochrome c family protein/plastocyanin